MDQSNDERDESNGMTTILDDFTIGIISMIEDGNAKTDLERFVKKYR